MIRALVASLSLLKGIVVTADQAPKSPVQSGSCFRFIGRLQTAPAGSIVAERAALTEHFADESDSAFVAAMSLR